jgi:hypothetical protein
MEPTSRNTWAKRVRRWKESGLSAKQFAAEIAVSAHSLTSWKRKLNLDEHGSTESTGAGCEQTTDLG